MEYFKPTIVEINVMSGVSKGILIPRILKPFQASDKVSENC